jgi:hypothetical protein
VRDAARRLVESHVELAKAELQDIAREVAKLAGAGLFALGCLGITATLLVIGGILFLDEWLFGSIGWGLVHGPLLLIAIGMMVMLAALGIRASRLFLSFLGGIALGIVAGIIFGLDLPHDAWTALADAVLPGVEEGVRPLVMAVLASAIVFAVVGLIVGARMGGGGAAVGGLLVGAVLGVLFGAYTAIDYSQEVAAAIGVKAWLSFWILFMLIAAARWASDERNLEALKNRVYPHVTIDTTKETLEWAKQQNPLGRKS